MGPLSTTWIDTYMPPPAIREAGSIATLLYFSAISLAAAAALGGVSYVVENATFMGYKFLENQGLIVRLVPEIVVTEDQYKLATFKTFVGSLFGVALFVCYNVQWLLQTAQPEWDPFKLIPAVWLITIIHDWWFWFVHMVMHKFKVLYLKIHSQHHVSGGDLTVFGTADMHLIEAFFLTMGFYALLLAFWLWKGTWNPVLFYAQVLLEASMNMGGHCGYLLPDWLQFLVTLGIGNTPWSASSTTHYIHHLDMRTNRALYFIWWDQLAGTYRPTHPKIKQMSREEWSEYNSRPWRLLVKRCMQGWAWLAQRPVGTAANKVVAANK